MKEFMSRIRADYLLSSLLCIALGVVFIVWNEQTISAIGIGLAVIMIIIGAVYLCSFFFSIVTNGLSAVIGAIVLLMGLWVLIQPTVIVTMIPIVIGVLLIGHGIRGVRESVAAKRFGALHWGFGIAFALISIILGAVCVVNAFGVLQLASIVIGIALIYNGVSNIYIAVTASKAEKVYRKSQEPIDVEFKDEEE